MTSQATADAAPDARPDELLVALPHDRPVKALLDDLRGNGPEPRVDRDDVLGLARIRFDAAATAAGLRSLPDWEQARTDRLGGWEPQDDGTPALDQALRGLRGVLGHRWSGWVPTMGKNRLVSSVEGGGRIWGGRLTGGGRIWGGRIAGAGRIWGGGGTAPQAARRQPAMPAATRPGAGVRVGVLDTGLSTRSQLAGCYARYSDLLLPDEDPSTRAGHATFIAGLVLSQAPGATVEVRRALDSTDATGDSWTVARRIVEFGADGVDVLNLSFLCFTPDDEPPMALSAAIDRLDPAIVVVAAAGNHGESAPDDRGRPAWPAALDDVVAVGAVDARGKHAPFSPPADLPWIDVRANGVDLVSTFLDGVPLAAQEDFPGFAQWSGTSFAAGLVSGAIAAATDPGRVPARAAWDDMRRTLARSGNPQPRLQLRVP